MVPFCGMYFLVEMSGDWDVRWGYDLGFDSWPNQPVFAWDSGALRLTNAASLPARNDCRSERERAVHAEESIRGCGGVEFAARKSRSPSSPL